jgi:hypothetical protein
MSALGISIYGGGGGETAGATPIPNSAATTFQVRVSGAPGASTLESVTYTLTPFGEAEIGPYVTTNGGSGYTITDGVSPAITIDSDATDGTDASLTSLDRVTVKITSFILDKIDVTRSATAAIPVSVSSAAITITGLFEGGADATRDVSGDFTLATAYAASGASGVGSPVLTGSELTVSPGIDGQTGSVVVTGSADNRASASITYSWTVGAASSAYAAVADRVINDTGYSWHIVQNVLHDTTADEIYVGHTPLGLKWKSEEWVDRAQYVARVDATGEYLGRVRFGSHTTTKWQSGTGEVNVPDEHNAVALALSGDGKLLAAGTGHGGSDTVWVSRSTDSTPANLAAPTELDTGKTGGGAEGATYTQFVVDGSDVYLFARSSPTTWCVFVSDDNGATWGSPVEMLSSAGQRAYARMIAMDAGDVVGLAWDHPVLASSDRGKIFHIAMDPTSITDQTLGSLTAIYTPPANYSSRVLATNDDFTAILFCEFLVNPNTHTGQSYKLLRLTGSDRSDPADWTEEDLGVDTESSFWQQSHYVGGGCFVGGGADVTEIVLARDTGSAHVLEYLSRPSAATAWSAATKATLDSTTAYVLARPFYANGFVIAQHIESFDPDFTAAIERAGVYPLDEATDFDAITYDIDAIPAAGQGFWRDTESGDATSFASDAFPAIANAAAGETVFIAISYPYDGGDSTAALADLPDVDIDGGSPLTPIATSAQTQASGTSSIVAQLYAVTVPPGGFSTGVVNVGGFSADIPYPAIWAGVRDDCGATASDTLTLAGQNVIGVGDLSGTIDTTDGGYVVSAIFVDCDNGQNTAEAMPVPITAQYQHEHQAIGAFSAFAAAGGRTGAATGKSITLETGSNSNTAVAVVAAFPAA